MIDTHAHIDAETYSGDFPEMLQRAFDAGIEYIIIPGIEPKSFNNILSIANSDKRIFAAFGIHPHNANEASEENLNAVEKYAKESKCVAIGEIGLDYYYDFAPVDVQIKAFINQINLAKKLKLPIIVHNREASDDILNILKDYRDGSLEVVLHCYSDGMDTLKRVLELGFHVSFTGNITFKKSSLTSIIEKVPMDKFMLETDSPFMTPVPFRGKRNEPAYLPLIAQKIAEIKSKPINEVIAMTNQTAIKFFKLTLACLVLVLFFANPIKVVAQEDIDEESISEAKAYINPYQKQFGFGPIFGTNTVVQTISMKEGDKPVSYEGIFIGGAYICYGIFDYLIAQLSYMHSKNIDVEGLEPDYDNIVDLSAKWIINPYSRINFFAVTGISGIFNLDNGTPVNKLGLNTGLGFFVNLNIKGAGLFTFLAEWRLDFPLGTYESNAYKLDQEGHLIFDQRVRVSTFYSIPRFGVVWFPKF